MFYGDPHGDYAALFQAVEIHKPEHVVIVGDFQLDQPLNIKLASVLACGIQIHWIHGNHDATTPAMHGYLFNAKGSLHACSHRITCHSIQQTNTRSAADSHDLVLAGLGGHYRGRIWFPRQGDETARYNTPEEFLTSNPVSARYKGGLPLHLRQAIFPQDHSMLGGLKGVDVLVCHEAPTSIGNNKGFGAIDDLAAQMGVRLVVHGHHHKSTSGHTRNGIAVTGLARAQVALLDPVTLNFLPTP